MHREELMSVVHRLFASKGKQAHIKFEQVCNTYRACFEINVDFESTLEPTKRIVKQTLYNKQNKMSEACVMLVFNVPEVLTQT